MRIHAALQPTLTTLVLLPVFALACGGSDAPIPQPGSSTLPSSLRGAVPTGSSRVRAITANGKTTVAPITNGSFSLPLPSEAFSVVFDGADGKAVANLAAPTDATGKKRVSVFAPPRRRGQALREGQSGLIEANAIFLGTITITIDVRIVEAEHNIFADIDSDGDGEVDFEDADDDGDGTEDLLELAWALDPDGDGELSELDLDDDGDGETDLLDMDDDNDGVPDASEADADGDGISDLLDLDDDNDGVLDTLEGEDTTPDALIGRWVGTTAMEIEAGNEMELDEVFVFGADGTLSGDFSGVDEETGCRVEYDLEGSWIDDADGTADLDVGWTSIELTISGCTNPDLDAASAEVVDSEGDIWDAELEGLWEVTGDTLKINHDSGVIEYVRGE